MTRTSRTDADTLRQLAGDRLLQKLREGSPLAGEAGIQGLVLALQVRQVELELQNDELSRERVEAEAALARYTDLFDFAPVGYFAFARDGSIREANLTGAGLLRTSRSALLGRRFEDFIDPASRGGFGDFLARAFADRGSESCELMLLLGEVDSPPLARLEGRVARSGHECRAVLTDISALKQAEDVIWRQANYDALTDLPNRRLFYDRLQQGINKTRRESLTLALLMVDLDRFKEVNDALGHAVGDDLLAQVARRIGGCLRATDTLARLGGDEFAVIMSELPDTDRVGQVAQNILDALAQPFQIGDEVVQISASVGIAFYPADSTNIDDLLRDSDQAMYAAKNQGRGRFRFFTCEMQAAVQARLTLIKDLRGALADGQFEVYFQPVVELATGRILKAEALLRWNHPRRGRVHPSEFIPVAEEIGLINEIGDWVFREAASWARRWLNDARGPIQVSINMSPRQFTAGDASEAWPEHLRGIGLPGSNMLIEVTEGLLLADASTITNKLGRFREAGMQIAIDDFGTGYSTLHYLNKFNIDLVKIDCAFVRDLETSAKASALVEAIVAMAHKLNIRVVAEGVETARQRDLLIAAGCDYAQGYLFTEPMGEAAIEAFLRGSAQGA